MQYQTFVFIGNVFKIICQHKSKFSYVIKNRHKVGTSSIPEKMPVKKILSL